MATDESMELPLFEGLQRWGDPMLLARFQKAEKAAQQLGPQNTVVIGSVHMDPRNARRNAEVRARQAHRRLVMSEFKIARAQLLTDLRVRIEYGRLDLIGLQTKPERMTTAVVIPAAWAPELTFDLHAGAVSVDGFKYVSCRLRQPAGPTRSVPAAREAPALDSAVAPALADDPKPIRRRGRENFDPLIEEALAARVDLVEDWWRKESERRHTASAVARLLEKWLAAEYRGRGALVKLPSFETIRKHLPTVYQRLLSGKPEQ